MVDLAARILSREPIDIEMGHLNFIWQRDANEHALRSLNLAASPPSIINVTGADVLSVRDLAERLGEGLGVEPVFTGDSSDTSLLNDASKSHELFGTPLASVDDTIAAVVAWLKAGNRTLGKPTKFQVRDGRF